jgi:putative serine/threonine protein kinase
MKFYCPKAPIKFIIRRQLLLAEGLLLKNPANVPLQDLREEPYASILCYPKRNEAELESRLEELEKHGVTAVEFAGKGNAFNVPVLGKGYVGVVVIAQRYTQRVALKIRRIDADRPSLMHEAEMLMKANSAGVGATFIEASKNFLLMQLIDGDFLHVWLETNKEKKCVRQVLTEVLEQCWQLDLAELDHGELSNAPKHLIIDKSNQPWIIDFESSSDTRKPANVTAICQYLFMSGGFVAKSLGETLGERNRGTVIEALRFYKHMKTRENLDGLMKACLY